MERLSISTLSSEVKVMFNDIGTRLGVVVDDDGRDDVLPKVPKESGTCTWKCNLLLSEATDRLVMARAER